MADTAAHHTENWIVDPQHTVPIVPVHTAAHPQAVASEPAAAPAAGDKVQLRNQLLRMILKSEAQRRGAEET